MPRLVTVRRLTLARASQPSRRRHLSAASGLVATGRYLYMIADDELHLGVRSVRGGLEIVVVTDADDSTVPARLLRVRLRA